MTKKERALRAVIAAANDEIDAAYWRFCRQARALPPVLAVPRAYERRNAAQAELDDLRRFGRSGPGRAAGPPPGLGRKGART